MAERIRHLNAEGKTLGEILEIVSQEGFKTAKGNLPSRNQIRMVLWKKDKNGKRTRPKKKKTIASALFETPQTEVQNHAFALQAKPPEGVVMLVFADVDSASQLMKNWMQEKWSES